MLFLRNAIGLLCLAAAATACDARSPTELARPSAETSLPDDSAAPTGLSLFLPRLAQAALTAGELNLLTPEPGVGGPALTEIGDEGLDDGARPLQAVFDPNTRVGYEEGYAWAVGSHKYIGNVGAIETSAHLSYQDQHVGSFTAPKQDYTPFLLDFGRVKFIWAQAKVYSDRECGLSVQGDSVHEAWWQFYQGRSVAEWGVARRSSQASPAEQEACARRTSQTTTSDAAASGMTCYYLVTYDLDTGEIVAAEFLFCTTGGTKI